MVFTFSKENGSYGVNIEWEKELIGEVKYITPKSKLRELVEKQRCDECGEGVNPASISENTNPQRMCGAIRFDYECKGKVSIKKTFQQDIWYNLYSMNCKKGASYCDPYVHTV